MIHEIYRGMLCLVLVREFLFFFENDACASFFFQQQAEAQESKGFYSKWAKVTNSFEAKKKFVGVVKGYV